MGRSNRTAKVEEEIFNHQWELVEKQYGKAEAEKANYGWGVWEGEDFIQVETKIYGPQEVLTTRWKDGIMTDYWEDR